MKFEGKIRLQSICRCSSAFDWSQIGANLDRAHQCFIALVSYKSVGVQMLGFMSKSDPQIVLKKKKTLCYPSHDLHHLLLHSLAANLQFVVHLTVLLSEDVASGLGWGWGGAPRFVARVFGAQLGVRQRITAVCLVCSSPTPYVSFNWPSQFGGKTEQEAGSLQNSQ